MRRLFAQVVILIVGCRAVEHQPSDGETGVRSTDNHYSLETILVDRLHGLKVSALLQETVGEDHAVLPLHHEWEPFFVELQRQPLIATIGYDDALGPELHVLLVVTEDRLAVSVYATHRSLEALGCHDDLTRVQQLN